MMAVMCAILGTISPCSAKFPEVTPLAIDTIHNSTCSTQHYASFSRMWVFFEEEEQNRPGTWNSRIVNLQPSAVVFFAGEPSRNSTLYH